VYQGGRRVDLEARIDDPPIYTSQPIRAPHHSPGVAQIVT
jgi:hypothetical protein